MDHSLIGIFILLPILIGYTRSNDHNRTDVVWRQDFPSDKTNINKYARKAQKSVWEISQFFHRWNIGLSQSTLKKTEVNAEGIGKTKRTFYGKLSKFTAKAAGVMGTIGAVFSLVMIFMPTQESAELKFMRTSFTKMNERLDNIASSVDEIKSIIPLETQKAAYKVHADKISYGSSRLKECLKRLEGVACINQTDCRRRRIAIVESFVTDFDVRGSVESILRGSTQDGVFGEALLNLFKESSRCNLPRINKMASGIAALILKGLTVASFKGVSIEADYDYSVDSTYLQNALFKLETKRQEVEKSCFKNIDSWIMQDLHINMKKASSDTEQTNAALLPIFATKYPWSKWYLISFISDEKPLMWSSKSIHGNLHKKSENHNVQTIAWPVRDGKVNAVSDKVSEMKKIFTNSGSNMNGILNSISENLVLKDQVTSISIIRGHKLDPKFVMSFYDNNGNMKHVYTTQGDQNPSIIESDQSNHYLLVYFKHEDDPLECSSNCHGHGDCFIFPHSSKTACRCKNGYSGEECNVTRTSLQLREDFNELLSLTLKLPTISSLKFSLEDSSMMLKASLDDISDAITSLGNIINNKFENFGSFMVNQLEWQNTLSQYKEPLQNLKYLTSIYYKDLKLSSLNVSQFVEVLKKYNTINQDFQNIQDGRCIILGPLGIRKWVSDINYLITGRNDDIFSSHRPLLFMVMDRLKGRLCYPDYKEQLDRAYHQLVLLQLQGYILWIQAHKTLNIDSTSILVDYANLINTQTEQLKNMMCSANIPNSTNLQSCTGGFYMHSKMDVKVICKDSFYLKEEEKMWVKDIVALSGQYSSTTSSANQIKGPPDVYPNYGDSVGAWKQAAGQVSGIQYLTVKFGKAVFVEEIRIYETLNCGAVKQIQALSPGHKWVTVWETADVEVITHSRIFIPEFKPLLFPTDEIKLILDPTKANNYVGIDAIMMIGRPLQNGEQLLWASDVKSFTSQRRSTSSAAIQITGVPDVYPSSGENSKAYSPSLHANGRQQITVKLNRTIFLKRIFIYETNNGGGVTAIQGFYFNGLWQTIWSKGMTENISGSRIFAPEFKMQTQKTDQIRITISSNPDGKFTEIDAVSALGFDKIPDTCSMLQANSCVPCECNPIGSKSTICDNRGNCTCKDGYSGKRCEDRDCLVDQWSSWSNCPCGETPQRTRSRKLIHNFSGNGKRCPSQSETSTCPFVKCVCWEPHFYGPKCKKRDCIVTDWQAWNRPCSRHCTQVHGSNGSQNRRRYVTAYNLGGGKGCPPQHEHRVCPNPKCKYRCHFSRFRIHPCWVPVD